jgi:hypothetical protein
MLQVQDFGCATFRVVQQSLLHRDWVPLARGTTCIRCSMPTPSVRLGDVQSVANMGYIDCCMWCLSRGSAGFPRSPFCHQIECWHSSACVYVSAWQLYRQFQITRISHKEQMTCRVALVTTPALPLQHVVDKPDVQEQLFDKP